MSGYVPLDREIWQLYRHEPNVLHVYLEILTGAPRGGPHPALYSLGLRAIARVLRLNPAQVHRALAVLEQDGWISRKCDNALCNGTCNGYRAMRTTTCGDSVTGLVTGLCTYETGDRDKKPPSGGRAPAPARVVPHAREDLRPAEDRGDAPPGQDPGETKPKARKKPAAPKPPDPRHARFIAWWTEHYPATHGDQPYRFDAGKDGGAVKALLQLFPADQSEQLATAVRRAWSGERDWWAEKATTLAGFRAIAQEVAAAPTRNGTAVQVRRRISSERDLDELESQFYRYGLDQGMTPDRALEYGVQRAAERRAAPVPAS